MIGQAVRVTSVPGTLLVLSSGLSTAGGFDMRQVEWGADPHAVAVWLNRRGLLPRLAGWHVVFSGLADTAGRQPALPLPQRNALTRYWMTICQVAGAASCAVDAVTRPRPPARSTTPVPVVTFPRVTSFRGPQGQTTDVPADAFFSFDSARLLPGADAVLEPLAAEARAQSLQVTITGFASPDGGTDAYNLALSAARAQAVRTRLIALGVPAGLVVKTVGPRYGWPAPIRLLSASPPRRGGLCTATPRRDHPLPGPDSHPLIACGRPIRHTESRRNLHVHRSQ